jgi:anti-sigma-K factor RskA
LWEQIENELAAPKEISRRRQSAHSFQSEDGADHRHRLLNWMRAGWQHSRWAWSGLAAVWMVILGLNLAAREPDAPLVAGQEVPSASEMRLALEQKYLLMSELAPTSEPAPADKPKPTRPSPRSDRRDETPNA